MDSRAVVIMGLFLVWLVVEVVQYHRSSELHPRSFGKSLFALGLLLPQLAKLVSPGSHLSNDVAALIGMVALFLALAYLRRFPAPRHLQRGTA